MTECERLIANGTFTRDFFKPEVRCDFLVTTKRKQIWAVEIDLLLQLDKVCKKHGLRYWIMGGTLLGCVRHRGFIPWDDDIDVLMFRDEYEKLCTFADEFLPPYFFQTPYTDPGYFCAYTKIRNSNTTCISEPFRYQGINLGIGIDIFVMDRHIPGHDAQARFDVIMQAIIDNSTHMRLTHPYLCEKDKKRVTQYSGGDPLERYEMIREMSMRDNEKDTELIWFPMGGVYGYKKCVFFRHDFDETVQGRFECFDFPIPKGNDRVLRCEYGDYMKLPPPEERGCWHGQAMYDPDIPYSQRLLELAVLDKQRELRNE